MESEELYTKSGVSVLLRVSTRAKHLRILVHADGRAEVVVPLYSSRVEAAKFVSTRSTWIEETRAVLLEKVARRKKRIEKAGGAITLPNYRRGTRAYKEAVEAARTLVHTRLVHFAPRMNARFGTVSIRNQKTRWGSCSAAGNLSFHYKILFLPPELQDYLIVHELAHTKEHNHSPRFWALVAREVPDYSSMRSTLRIRYES